MLGVDAGHIFDFSSTLPDLRLLYPATPNETLAGKRYSYVTRRLREIQFAKSTAKSGRNFWQETERRPGRALLPGSRREFSRALPLLAHLFERGGNWNRRG